MTTKLENRTAKIGVIGLGYVGLPLVLLFSEQDFRITGFDVDAKKIDIIKRGGSYIVRIPETEIQAAKSKGFTRDRGLFTDLKHGRHHHLRADAAG